MATNSHSVKYETLRFGHGPLVFLLYNFINKVHANIDTELCTRLNFFDLKTLQKSFFEKLDQTILKRLKCIKKLSNMTCGLSTSACNLLTFLFDVCNNRPVRVIGRAGKRPEITVTLP